MAKTKQKSVKNELFLRFGIIFLIIGAMFI